jgi:ABC-2 type transport system ATP-binding protein
VLIEDKTELMRKLGRKQLTLELARPLHAMPPRLQVYDLELITGGSQLVFNYDTQAEQTGIPALLADLNREGIEFKDLRTTQSSLEDIFVTLVKDPA